MISVAMITMNEEKAVGTVIENILNVVPDAEILIVDSSDDNTAEIAESMGARVICQYPPQGYGRAMELALRSAAGDVVVTLDCDDTYPAEVIPEIARYVLDDVYDLVDCSRLKTKPEAMPWINYLANKAFAWLASLLFSKHLTDLHSGMRAYRKSMLDDMEFDASGAALPVELLLKPLASGYRVKVFFIGYRERIGKTTMRPLESAWWTAKRILRVRFGKRHKAGVR
ncbi:MAG: glycosyltransferase family 2 protein [Actinobacteria bacterium]|nr:glycosyltransferase family 2 protein [Actinomycetota bacterium]